MPENLSGYIAVAVVIIWFVGMLVWFFRRQYGPTTTVRATVVNKQVTESFSKHSGTGKSNQYYVTFLIGKKRRSFRVSEFSYGGYHKGETGTLKYKGDRIIDFQ
ncbi:MAG: DUF2500 domain-containing protein [Ruminococcaceae bacterium]|nr:DUF2500 domain-containing protein [Oscillospiraceae bacterium]